MGPYVVFKENYKTLLCGTLRETQTPDPTLRRRMLYSPEILGHVAPRTGFEPANLSADSFQDCFLTTRTRGTFEDLVCCAKSTNAIIY